MSLKGFIFSVFKKGVPVETVSGVNVKCVGDTHGKWNLYKLVYSSSLGRDYSETISVFGPAPMVVLGRVLYPNVIFNRISRVNKSWPF